MSGTSDDGAVWDSWFRPEPAAAQLPPVTDQRPPHPQQHGRHGRPAAGPTRKRRKLPYLLVAAVLVVAAGITAVFVLPRGPATPTTGYLPTGSSPGQDARQTASAFLRAWDAGNFRQAANYTNRPAIARAALKAFGTGIHLGTRTSTAEAVTAVSSNPSAPRATVRYAASASVAAAVAPSVRGTWHYHASLVAYRGKHTQYWYIAWAPSDLAPNLTPATHLATISVPPRVTSVTDAGGNNLTSYGDAGLNHVTTNLEAGAPPGHGTPGVTVEIQNATGTAVAHTPAVVVAPKNVAGLATTIDGSAEQAARAAVAQHNDSSMIVIQPSTGKILAVANNAGFNDFALTAAVAPGSTMKTITATALFNAGVLTPNSQVACPKTFTIQGITYHNDKGESEPASTPFITDFAQSCNNAFSTQWQHLTGGRLAETVRDYYGLDQRWNIGLGNLAASYFNAPASASGSELAQEAFGEGSLTASPLAMASIAATISTGTFRQPYLAAGGPRVTAKPLPASTDSWLKEMMRAVVTSGTAASVGFGSDVYAKTGTADVNGQGQPNSWLLAFEPSRDVAVACLVVNAGYGAQVAGPEVKAFFDRY